MSISIVYHILILSHFPYDSISQFSDIQYDSLVSSKTYHTYNSQVLMFVASEMWKNVWSPPSPPTFSLSSPSSQSKASQKAPLFHFSNSQLVHNLPNESCYKRHFPNFTLILHHYNPIHLSSTRAEIDTQWRMGGALNLKWPHLGKNSKKEAKMLMYKGSGRAKKL